MITLNDFSNLICNYEMMLVYSDDYESINGELNRYAKLLFTIKSDYNATRYLKKIYANAKVQKANFYNDGIVRVLIKEEDAII